MKDAITLTIQEANEILSLVAKFPYENKGLIETIARLIDSKFQDEVANDSGNSELPTPSES